MRANPLGDSKRLLTLFLAAAVTLCGSTLRSEPFVFLGIGDVPYNDEQNVLYQKLLKQAAKENFSFLLHVGDIKGQGEPCSDERLARVRDDLRRFPAPVVYSPGDNEWTDCHGKAAGSYDPRERLEKIRELFFADKSVLRLSQLNVTQQSDDDQYAKFVENYRFSLGGVIFINVHVVGSGNGLNLADRDAVIEFQERNIAVLAFLEESFAVVQKENPKGVAIVIHANPHFERRDSEGYEGFNNAVEAFLRTYRKPVVCFHGDSHYYRIDKPLRDSETRRRFLHFTRMEVFGSPDVAGVKVTVDASKPEVFTYEPYYLAE